MRIVIAKCSAFYTGRTETETNPAIRAIIIKDDGAVSVHCDVGNKPLNYMGAKNKFTETLEEDTVVWSFDTTTENLTLRLHEVISDSDHVLEKEDTGTVNHGTEYHLQAWLADNPEAVGEGFTLVQREFETGEGRVDLLMKDSDGEFVVVEVKRVALSPAVTQVKRYREALQQVEGYENVRAKIAALEVRNSAIKMAVKHNVDYVVVDADWKAKALEVAAALPDETDE